MRYDFGAGLLGLFVTILGVTFLLDALDVLDLRFEVILPVFAIAAGFAVIASSLLRSRET